MQCYASPTFWAKPKDPTFAIYGYFQSLSELFVKSRHFFIDFYEYTL